MLCVIVVRRIGQAFFKTLLLPGLSLYTKVYLFSFSHFDTMRFFVSVPMPHQ